MSKAGQEEDRWVGGGGGMPGRGHRTSREEAAKGFVPEGSRNADSPKGMCLHHQGSREDGGNQTDAPCPGTAQGRAQGETKRKASPRGNCGLSDQVCLLGAQLRQGWRKDRKWVGSPVSRAS